MALTKKKQWLITSIWKNLQLTTDLISRPTPQSFAVSFGSSANGSAGQIMKARSSISVSFDLDFRPAEVDLFVPECMSFEVAFISDF